MEQSVSTPTKRIPKWVLAIFPIVVLIGLIILFIATVIMMKRKDVI